MVLLGVTFFGISLQNQSSYTDSVDWYACFNFIGRVNLESICSSIIPLFSEPITLIFRVDTYKPDNDMICYTFIIFKILYVELLLCNSKIHAPYT